VSTLDEALFDSQEQQAGLERAYDLLFEHGKRSETGPYERKDFALTADAMRQYKEKLVETIAGMANSGHSVGLILCRERDPAAVVGERIDADQLDQAVRATVGPRVSFTVFRREIRARV
jgi:hypothetical protein